MNGTHGVAAPEQIDPRTAAELDRPALAELAGLLGDALGCQVSIGQPPPRQRGDVLSFPAYDERGRPRAVARWASSPESAAGLLAEAEVLAGLETWGEGSVLVAPRLLALTRWRGGTLLVREWRAPSYPTRPPSRQERHAAERAVAALGTPADLDESYAELLRSDLLRLPPSPFADRLSATLDRLAARHDLDHLPRGAWHGHWAPGALAAAGDGRVLVWGWRRFAPNRPLGFDTLHFRLAELRALPRSAGAGPTLIDEAPRLLARWHGRVVPESEGVARLLLIELAARELREIGVRQAPVSWTADWIAPMVLDT
ncbi:hypothetical protein FHP29_13590 [Nocardioides albidus]|uniref:Aminoglycoside phosphotransferase domain-containing protein n=1 Tax=Nocardioides albidus TaxID=1517589 RepID=A0A5C4VQT9_9ACTN|nr:hypothetical protein [Nocardioides albidus]TNM38304.1 hypothetical protein FHP29_13590 [Nocardioides albidus]